MAEALPDHEHIERVVVLSNPVCTRAHTVGRRIAELQASHYGANLMIVQTEPEQEATQEKLQQTLIEGDVLCIAGGDGTVNTAVKAVDKTPIFPLWGGNGNDLANMLNGRPSQRPSKILDTAQIVPIRPIQADITNEFGTQTEIASAYAGFGAGAIGALKLNDSKHRRRLLYNVAAGRVLYEADLLLTAFAQASEFSMTRNKTEQSMYDLTVANGPRIAKFGRLPVQLAEDRLFAFNVRHKRLQLIARRMAALATGQVPGQYLSDKHALEFTTHDPIMGHFDAEPQIIFSESHVVIRQRKEPFYAITTKAQESLGGIAKNPGLALQ